MILSSATHPTFPEHTHKLFVYACKITYVHEAFPSKAIPPHTHCMQSEELCLQGFLGHKQHASECSEPHVETAVVYAITPTSLLVFVPSFHLKGSIHMTDRAGLVRLPVTAPGQDADDAFFTSQRRRFKLESGLLGKRQPCKYGQWSSCHAVRTFTWMMQCSNLPS